MVGVIDSPADVINLALVRIGYPHYIGDLYCGSEASAASLRIYSQTRDQLLRDGNWDFARRDLTMALLKQAPAGGYVPPNGWTPAYPPQPWMYEYTWPEDCLKVRGVRPAALFLPVFDPQPYIYSTPNDDAFDPPRKVIVCNVADAILTYTGQVTDPLTWEVSFIEDLASELARRLVPALAKDPNLLKQEDADEQGENAMASETRG